MRETRGSSRFRRSGGKDAQIPFGTCGTKGRETHDSAGSDEKVTMGLEEFGTFGTLKVR
ncbi:hypothetical protein KI387_039155, partial [Taxus chinensis]